jgi:hypothetical protein
MAVAGQLKDADEGASKPEKKIKTIQSAASHRLPFHGQIMNSICVAGNKAN